MPRGEERRGEKGGGGGRQENSNWGIAKGAKTAIMIWIEMSWQCRFHLFSGLFAAKINLLRFGFFYFYFFSPTTYLKE